MTVATATTNRAQENGNGVKVAFDFDFRIFSSSELTVYKVTIATSAQAEQTISTDYTVAINGIDNALTTPGGTVTYTVAPTALEQSLIISNYTLDQQSDIPVASNFPEVVVEDALDKLTLIAIQLNEEIGRSAKLPSASSLTDLELPIPVADKAILWNSSANALVNSTNDFDDIVTDATTQATAAAASASAAATSASAASTSATAAAASASSAATDAAAAQAAVGGVRVSSNDTTADNLEAKLLVGSGFSLSTQNDGANETRTVSLDVNGLTDVTITASDEILYGDVSDSNNIKKDTVQGIIDLAAVPSQATQAAIEAETDENTYAPPDLIKHSPGVIKAWLVMGVDAVADDSYNIASIDDDGAGDWGIHFTTSFSTADYVMFGAFKTNNSNPLTLSATDGTQAVGAIDVELYNTSSTKVETGITQIYLAFVGDQ